MAYDPAAGIVSTTPVPVMTSGKSATIARAHCFLPICFLKSAILPFLPCACVRRYRLYVYALKVGSASPWKLERLESGPLYQGLTRKYRYPPVAISVPSDVRYTRSIERGMAMRQILATIAKYRPHLLVMGTSGLARQLPILQQDCRRAQPQ